MAMVWKKPNTVAQQSNQAKASQHLNKVPPAREGDQHDELHPVDRTTAMEFGSYIGENDISQLDTQA